MTHARPVSILALTTLSTLTIAPAAIADSLGGTRGSDMREHEHVMTVKLARGHADVVVRRVVYNGSADFDEAVYTLDVPWAAVATGLRTKGTGGRWFEADLLDSDEAARKYEELTGLGIARPKDPALLSWVSSSSLNLQVFPIASKEEKTIEYSLRVPTTYVEGKDVLQIPEIGLPNETTRVVIVPEDARDRVEVLADGALAARVPGAGEKIALGGGLEVRWASAHAAGIDGRVASVPISYGRAMSHFRVEAAEHIAEAPRAASVVLLLDASRSLTEGTLSAEIAAARAYVKHLPDARVAVYTFDRAPRPLTDDAFVSSELALAALEHASLDLRNGSAVDRALARADALLSLAPPSSPRRVILMTDLETKTALTPEKAGNSLSHSRALLHIGVVTEGDASLTRDDDSPWAKVARATGGLVWQAGASDSADQDDLARIYEEWVRPLRLDHFKLEVPGTIRDSFDLPTSLDEGASYEDLRITQSAVPAVEISGELWSRPFIKVLRPTAPEGKLWAALSLNADVASELTDKDMLMLARLGGAVSPLTSYLAVEPGVRPSTAGFERGSGVGEGGGGVGEGIGLGRIGTIGHGSADSRDDLLDAVTAIVAQCNVAKGHAAIEIETTRAELVDVTVSLDDAEPKQRTACVEEAAWGIELELTEPRETYSFSL